MYDNMAKLNLAEWIACTEVEGPGKRLALWVQGCLLQCPQCCNPHMLSFEPKNIVSTKDILSWIAVAQKKYEIEGVSFLGGEPMLQAKGLAEVAKGCKALGLSVIVFTGYTFAQLEEQQFPGTSELLSQIDLLIDGQYIAAQAERKRNWVGSTNQEFHFFSDFYQPGIEYDATYPHGFEVRISLDGTVQTNGSPIGEFLEPNQRSAIHGKIASKGEEYL